MIQLQTGCTILCRDPRNQRWATPARHGALALNFDPADPAAVTLVVEDVPWRFDRTLLADAVGRPPTAHNLPVGCGDVRVSRHGLSRVHIRLNSPDGEALLELPLGAVTTFVDQIDAAHPDDDHLYDVDAWIAGLLGASS